MDLDIYTQTNLNHRWETAPIILNVPLYYDILLCYYIFITVELQNVTNT